MASVIGAQVASLSQARLGPLRASKWGLANGLQIILLPDAAATNIAYMSWFRVGSRHENAAAGETGLAHLFEHLMFTQTRGARGGAGQFDRQMESAGASTNAMTYYDFTAYVDLIPPSALAQTIAIEADRMVNLSLQEAQLVTEREVVIEERKSTVEDSVDGLLDEKVFSQAFTRHPYRHPVIGLMKDIQSITRHQAMNFYRAHYAPNNAIVVVTGQFAPEMVLTEIHRRYAPLPPSPTLPRQRVAPERAPARLVRSRVGRPLSADRMAMGFPAPALGHRDRPAMEVLNQLLTGGPSSRLHRKLLLDEEIASSVHGDVSSTQHPGLFTLWIQMRRGHRAPRAEEWVMKEIAALIHRPPSQTELGRARRGLEAAFWEPLLTSEGRAEQLGHFEVSTGDYRNLFRRARQVAAVTGADVQRVAHTYLRGEARSVVVAYPARPATPRTATSRTRR